MADRGLSWIRKEQALLEHAAAARGVKPVSDLPGAGFGSFAEDDPQLHASYQTPPEPTDTSEGE